MPDHESQDASGGTVAAGTAFDQAYRAYVGAVKEAWGEVDIDAVELRPAAGPHDQPGSARSGSARHGTLGILVTYAAASPIGAGVLPGVVHPYAPQVPMAYAPPAPAAAAPGYGMMACFVICLVPAGTPGHNMMMPPVGMMPAMGMMPGVTAQGAPQPAPAGPGAPATGAGEPGSGATGSTQG